MFIKPDGFFWKVFIFCFGYGLFQDRIRNIRICPKVTVNFVGHICSQNLIFEHFNLIFIQPADLYKFGRVNFRLQEIYAGNTWTVVWYARFHHYWCECKIRIREFTIYLVY